MPSQRPPGDRTPRTPPAPPSVPAAKSCPYAAKCIVLLDWWLERVDDKICIAGLTETPQMRKVGIFSQESKKSAARVFKCAIAKVCDSTTVETLNGHVVWIKGILNNSRMRENGFSKKVCECFMGGFPFQWEKLVDSNIEQMKGHAQSLPKSTDNAPSASVEYYLEKFMSDSFVNSKGYSFAENHFNSFRDRASSDLGKAVTSNNGKTSVKLGTGDEVLAAGITPQFGARGASEENKGRTLRSGRVLGAISAPTTGGKKQKRTQLKASENTPNEAVSPTADLTSTENVCSVSAVFSEDKLKSYDSRSKGRGRPAKKKKSSGVFTNFL